MGIGILSTNFLRIKVPGCRQRGSTPDCVGIGILSTNFLDEFPRAGKEPKSESLFFNRRSHQEFSSADGKRGTTCALIHAETCSSRKTGFEVHDDGSRFALDAGTTPIVS